MSNSLGYDKRGNGRHFLQNINTSQVAIRDTEGISFDERFMLSLGFWPVTTPDSTVKRWQHPETDVTVHAENVAEHIAQVKAQRAREQRKAKRND